MQRKLRKRGHPKKRNRAFSKEKSKEIRPAKDRRNVVLLLHRQKLGPRNLRVKMRQQSHERERDLWDWGGVSQRRKEIARFMFGNTLAAATSRRYEPGIGKDVSSAENFSEAR